MGVNSYFIQYKFIIPEHITHSSYTYQKLFRALYGYTQAVFKSNGKVYHYRRGGVLSTVPYLRPGKNCVIIPPGSFQTLIDFFKTGHNPTHRWRGKGEWKAVYYMNEKDIDPVKAADAIVNLLERTQVWDSPEKTMNILEGVKSAASPSTKENVALIEALIYRAKPAVENVWFKEVYQHNPILKDFYSAYKEIKKN